MDPILKNQFNNFKNQFEIDTSAVSPEKFSQKEAIAFERFVNYVLFSLDYPEIFTADLELLDAVCVGGGNDTGIDGIGIKINDRLVISIDEVKEIANGSNKIVVDFVFIQTKMSSKFDTAELSTFGTGVKVFFSEGYLPENSKIKLFRDIKNFIYSNEKVISKLENNPNIFLYYVATGNTPTDANFSGHKKWLENELTEGFYFETVNINAYGGKQLINFCRELENKFEVQLNIIDIFPLIVDMKDDIKKSYAFTCKANEFMRLIVKDDGSLRRSLFNDNVRDYLGSRSAVNNEIEITIRENPEMFLLCNNGVTIVCSNFEQVRDKLVKFENPQIVNGCQTTNSIYNLRELPNIEKVQLLVRLISTDNHIITNKIVRGTNKQNQVLDEAFEVTLPFHQDLLEPFFLAMSNEPKIYYERRAKQYNNDPHIKKTRIVNLRILTKTFVSMFLNSPHQSHRHEAKLLEEYARDKGERRIFRDDHSPYPYYICALTWYMFEKLFRENRHYKRYKTYEAHLYLIFRISIGEFPPKLVRSKALDAYCEKLLTLLEEDQFLKRISDVIGVFDNTERLWIEKRSRHGIKDNKEFTDLLIKQATNYFIKKQTQADETDDNILYEGEILRIVWRPTHWFGFISRGYQYDNVYFDKRAFNGEPRELIPTTKVQYEVATGPKGIFAKSVRLVE